jgi:DNA-binding HxlR family transcriptional regulator
MPTRTPLPGRPVRGSASGRPVMALLDLLGRRGQLRLLWELRDGQPQTFRVLQASAGEMSPSVLNDRLKELREARLVELGDAGYQLSEAGRGLVKHLKPLNRWAEDWAAAANLPFSP